MSALFSEVYQVLQVNHTRTTPYHPQADGLVERFNGTLKVFLKKFANKQHKDWDKYYLLFAYQEVYTPQKSKQFLFI